MKRAERLLLLFLLGVLLVSIAVPGLRAQQQPTVPEKPAWDVTLKPDFKARSNITIVNHCKRTHRFAIRTDNLPFLHFLGEPQVSVPGSGTRDFPIQFDTSGMKEGTYTGKVIVICVTCGSEPTCSQDRELLPVKLSIAPPPSSPTVATPAPRTTPVATTTETQPCQKTTAECEELRRVAEQKEAEAAAAQASADAARADAQAKEKAAAEAEEAAKKAAEAAKEPGEGSSWIAGGGRRITERDLNLKRKASQQAWNDYKAGKISAQELEQKWKELGEEGALEKLREADRKERERLKGEAAEAAKKAAEARAAADAARAATDAAQKAADAAKAAVAAARAAYEDCLRRLKEECERARTGAAGGATAPGQPGGPTGGGQAGGGPTPGGGTQPGGQPGETEAQRLQREHTLYLLQNIRDLGLITYPGFWETPGLFDWLPPVLEKPVGDAVEEIGKVPIPLDVFKALSGLYSIAAALLDPCTALGKRKTIERLQERINPKTGARYTLEEAMTKTEEMCELLVKIKTLAEKAHK